MGACECDKMFMWRWRQKSSCQLVSVTCASLLYSVAIHIAHLWLKVAHAQIEKCIQVMVKSLGKRIARRTPARSSVALAPVVGFISPAPVGYAAPALLCITLRLRLQCTLHLHLPKGTIPLLLLCQLWRVSRQQCPALLLRRMRQLHKCFCLSPASFDAHMIDLQGTKSQNPRRGPVLTKLASWEDGVVMPSVQHFALQQLASLAATVADHKTAILELELKVAVAETLEQRARDVETFVAVVDKLETRVEEMERRVRDVEKLSDLAEVRQVVEEMQKRVRDVETIVGSLVGDMTSISVKSQQLERQAVRGHAGAFCAAGGVVQA